MESPFVRKGKRQLRAGSKGELEQRYPGACAPRAALLWEICFMRCDSRKQGYEPQRARPLPGSDFPSPLWVPSPTATRKAKRFGMLSATSYLRQSRDFYSSIPRSSDLRRWNVLVTTAFLPSQIGSPPGPVWHQLCNYSDVSQPAPEILTLANAFTESFIFTQVRGLLTI